MLHLTLRQLEIFTAVAHSGSTVAAAPVVALSQSATSAALQQLESGLGTPLFERAGRGLVLNDAGRALLPQALALLEQARAIEQAFRTQGAGLPVRLRVAASTTIGSYVLPRVLAALARSHPQVSVDLHIGNTREVAEAVQALQADLGLIEGATHWPGLETAPWLRDELVLVAAPDDPLAQAARQRPLGVVALRGARWLLREQGSGTRDNLERFLRAHGVKPLAADELGSNETLKQAVMAGMGIAFLSHHTFAMEVESGRLLRLDVADTPVIREWNVVSRTDRPMTPALDALLDFLQTEGAARMRAMEC